MGNIGALECILALSGTVALQHVLQHLVPKELGAGYACDRAPHNAMHDFEAAVRQQCLYSATFRALAARCKQVTAVLCRSVTMDAWTDDQLKKMQLGGNDRLIKHLKQCSIDKSTPIPAKYNSKGAEVCVAVAPPANQMHKHLLKSFRCTSTCVHVRDAKTLTQLHNRTVKAQEVTLQHSLQAFRSMIKAQAAGQPFQMPPYEQLQGSTQPEPAPAPAQVCSVCMLTPLPLLLQISSFAAHLTMCMVWALSPAFVVSVWWELCHTDD